MGIHTFWQTFPLLCYQFLNALSDRAQLQGFLIMVVPSCLLSQMLRPHSVSPNFLLHFWTENAETEILPQEVNKLHSTTLPRKEDKITQT